MSTTKSTAEKVAEPSIETLVGTNAYGDYYEYHACTGCGAEAGERWQVEQICECGQGGH